MTSARASARPWWIDGLRARVYRQVAPVVGPLFADRDRRVWWLAVFSIAISFLGTLLFPLWLLALGPLLLGVPHLVADARYLVVQPGVHRRGPLVWLAAVPLVLTGVGAPPVISLLVMVPALLVADGAPARKGLAALAWLALSAVALRWEVPFLYAFLHAHNLVALGLWASLRPRGPAWWGLVAVVLGLTAALLLGWLEPLGTWRAPATASTLDDFVNTTAPFVDAPLAMRVVLSFCFLQSLHYAVWLRLVPEDARSRPAPRPFRDSWRALQRDFGAPLLAVFVALGLGFAAWGLVDLAHARLGYLRLAAFHGYLELGAAVLFFIERRRLS